MKLVKPNDSFYYDFADAPLAGARIEDLSAFLLLGSFRHATAVADCHLA
ncbi:MAG: hypothetical protein QMC95_17795 [Desulfitobacteriaceae bacterium]|nr:hypothetical protein [Desulfitobacteriaceae bacterium]